VLGLHVALLDLRVIGDELHRLHQRRVPLQRHVLNRVPRRLLRDLGWPVQPVHIAVFDLHFIGHTVHRM